MVNTFSVNASARSLTVAPHLALLPPDPVPVLLPHVEGCPMWWGWAFASIAETVQFDRAGVVQLAEEAGVEQAAPLVNKLQRAVQLGHDVGFGIPHVSVPNAFLPAVIAFSKCQVHFGKSTVLAAGKPAGYWLPAAAMFQVCADPISLPIGFNVTALVGTTVKFGFSWGDQFAGLVRVGIDIAISRLVSRLYGRFVQKHVTRLVQRLLPARLSQIIDNAIAPFTARESDRLGEDAIDEVIRRGKLQFRIEKAIHDAIERLANRGVNKGFEKDTKRRVKQGTGDLRELGPWIDSQIDEPPPEVDEDIGPLEEVPMLEGGEDP